MKRHPIKIEIHYIDDKVNLVVPQQPGLTFEDVAARLAALAEEMAVELQLPVEIVSGPEQHLHGPKEVHTHVGGKTHAH